MRDFKFREIDSDGWDTLDVISEAYQFNEWMFDEIKKFCTGKVLEIGSGIGNISAKFIAAGYDITLSDIRENYCTILREKFPARPVVQMDLTHPGFDVEYAGHLSCYDSIFALNVVEHIQDDSLAIANCFKLLKYGGSVVILVPAFQELYNRFDAELEHYRRYNRSMLNGLLVQNNFRVAHSRYFNFMGIPGWYFSGKLQNNRTIPRWQMGIYNKLVPLFKIVDKCLFHTVGLSVISVGVKDRSTSL